MRDRLLTALAQAALERIPAATDTYRAVTNHNRIATGGDYALRGRCSRFKIGPGGLRSRSTSRERNAPLGASSCILGDQVPRFLQSRRSDIAISFGAMHHGISDPLGAVPALVPGPLTFRFQIRFVIGRKALNLALVEAGLKIIFMLSRGAQAFSGNEELL